MLDDDGAGAVRDRVGDESVSVHLGPSQGEEDAARLHLTGIGVIGGEPLADLGAADLTTARGLEDLEEGQTHLHK